MLCIVYLLYYVNKHQEKNHYILITIYAYCECTIVICQHIAIWDRSFESGSIKYVVFPGKKKYYFYLLFYSIYMVIVKYSVQYR